MNILVTNDDGIQAQGIGVLAKAASRFGKVTVVAPARQCSAMSHRITLGSPMRLERVEFPWENVTAYSLTGTPADCVKAALDAILPEKPDVVLSGINHGYNVGFDVVYSGTVGAAMEALMNGIPAIALSQNHLGNFCIAERYLPQILEELLPAGTAETADPPGAFELKIVTDVKTEVFYHCRWTSVKREFSREGLRKTRRGIAMLREEKEDDG